MDQKLSVSSIVFQHMQKQYGDIYSIKKTREEFANNTLQEDIKKKLEDYLFYLRQTRPNMN
jgi:hypothetical protein